MTFAQRLKQLRQAAGYTQQDIADRIGVSRVAVTKWENGKVEPGGENASNLASLFRVQVKDLFGYDPSSIPQDAMPIAASPEATVPIYELGNIHAGEPIEAIEDKKLIQVPVEVAHYHEHGYMLRVEGHCMDRVYPEGCHVLIDPDMAPHSGCAVAAMLDGGDVVLRRYYRGSDTLMLVADSATSSYDDLIFKGSYTNVKLLGVVCWFQASEDLRYSD